MTTRLQYTTNLQSKLLNLEDGGYGDFDYGAVDLNFFVSMSISRLFPAVYKRVRQTGLVLVSYGSLNMSLVTPHAPALPERVYLIEDSSERTPMLGWRVSNADVINIDPWQSSSTSAVTNVDIHYYDAYSCPTGTSQADDNIDLGIPAVFEPLIQLGALIEACEARQDTGVRGDPPPIGQLQEMPLLDRLNTRYKDLRNEMAMAMPVVLM